MDIPQKGISSPGQLMRPKHAEGRIKMGLIYIPYLSRLQLTMLVVLWGGTMDTVMSQTYCHEVTPDIMFVTLMI